MIARDLAIDQTTGDLALVADSTDVALVYDGPAIEQDAASRMRTFLGEWFLDQTIGVDYFGVVFVKAPQQPIVREVFRRELIATPGVTSISSLRVDVDLAARRARADYVAVGDVGALTASVVSP